MGHVWVMYQSHMGHTWVIYVSHMGHAWVIWVTHESYLCHMGFIHGSQMCRAAFHVIIMMHLAKKYNVNPLIITMLHLAVTLRSISAIFFNFHSLA